jgi:apolipoprotein N-acyltransferase
MPTISGVVDPRGRVRASRWAFAVGIVGSSVSVAAGLPASIAVVSFGVLAGIVFLLKLHGSFNTENVLDEASVVYLK